MIKIKFENRKKAQETLLLINEYEKYDRYIKVINAALFVIVITLACINIPLIIPFIIFFIAVILNLFKVIDKTVDQFCECPCEVNKFRKNHKEVLNFKELMNSYKEVKDFSDDYPYAIVIKKKGDIFITESEEQAYSIKLEGKWKLDSKIKGSIYTIDFDDRKIY